MAAGIAKKRSSDENALWIFRWHGAPASAFPKLFPIILATMAFAFLLFFIRIKVAEPQFEMGRKASWIHLPASGDGLLWTMRAKEGGPSLSRCEPSSWSSYASMEQEVLKATQLPSTQYRPKLRELPQDGSVEPLNLSSTETVFPRREAAAVLANEAAKYGLMPVLYPLSELGKTKLPQSLPPLHGTIDASTAAAEWRFLLRLNPEGGVTECVSLTNAIETGPVRLENWLRGVTFDPKLAKDGGWIAVGIQFQNQPIHGPDAR